MASESGSKLNKISFKTVSEYTKLSSDVDFPIDSFTDQTGQFISFLANSLNCSNQYVASTVLTMLSSCAGTCRIKSPLSHLQADETRNLPTISMFMILLGGVSTGKTTAVNTCFRGPMEYAKRNNTSLRNNVSYINTEASMAGVVDKAKEMEESLPKCATNVLLYTSDEGANMLDKLAGKQHHGLAEVNKIWSGGIINSRFRCSGNTAMTKPVCITLVTAMPSNQFVAFMPRMQLASGFMERIFVAIDDSDRKMTREVTQGQTNFQNAFPFFSLNKMASQVLETYFKTTLIEKVDQYTIQCNENRTDPIKHQMFTKTFEMLVRLSVTVEILDGVVDAMRTGTAYSVRYIVSAQSIRTASNLYDYSELVKESFYKLKEDVDCGVQASLSKDQMTDDRIFKAAVLTTGKVLILKILRHNARDHKVRRLDSDKIAEVLRIRGANILLERNYPFHISTVWLFIKKQSCAIADEEFEHLPFSRTQYRKAFENKSLPLPASLPAEIREEIANL